MIVTRLKGGLGNQLFQYSATRAVAVQHSADFYFDISYFQKTKNGDLYLNKFSNTILPMWEGKCRLPKFADDFNYKPIPDNVYLTGWWQSEKYFKPIEKLIRDELAFSQKTVEYVNKKYSFLKNNSVSLHVRRGDYIGKENEYPFPGIDYYKNAYDDINDKNVEVVILSDDIQWCKENFKFSNANYIEDETDIVDLCIMATCSHNVICNSTYSWWGAWLNNKPNKTVIAPKVWFGPAIENSDADIIPKNWKKL